MNYKMNPAINTFRPLMELETLLGNAANKQSFPKLNIIKVENGSSLEIAVPGLKKENLNIDIDDNILKISAESEKDENEITNYIIKEFDYRNFSREFKLSDKVDQNKISAEYSDGILKISLPNKINEKLIKKIELI